MVEDIVEVCCTNLNSCLVAEQCGADRIELCSVIDCGGVTPSIGLLSSVLEKVKLPVHVLIRPREGSFVYSDFEIDVMVRDIVTMREMGVAGIVSGVLNLDNHIDQPKLQALMDATGTLPFSFSRAIDVVENQPKAMGVLLNMGCSAVLTSGGELTVKRGFKSIMEMYQIAEGKMEVLVGGGLDIETAISLKKHGIRQFHLSARHRVVHGEENELFENSHSEVSPKLLSEFVRKLKGRGD